MDYRLKQIYEQMLRNTEPLKTSPTPSLVSIIEEMAKSSAKSPKPKNDHDLENVEFVPDFEIDDNDVEFEPEGSKKATVTPLSYDDLVSKRLGGNIRPRKTYLIGKSTKITDVQDLENFKKLFDLSPPTKSDTTGEGTSKGSGKGEMAIYWLLKKKYPSIRDNRSGDLPDLDADGIGLEIKSYPKDKGFKLGKFKAQTENRNILSVVLGIKALSEIKGNAKRVAAVDVFNGKEILSAFDLTIKLAKAFGELDTNVVNMLKDLPLIAQLQNQFNEVGDFLGKSLAEIEPIEAAGITLKRLIREKCSKKPKFGGYVVNLLSDGTIEYYEANEARINLAENEDAIKYISATSGELAISKPEYFFIKS